MNRDNNIRRYLVSEIIKKEIGTEVQVRGKIIEVLKRPNKGEKGIAIVKLKDNTGDIKIRICNVYTNSRTKELFSEDHILIVSGKLAKNRMGETIIEADDHDQSKLHSHASIEKAYQNDDAELKEQQSRMIISKICRVLSQALEEKGYLEISTKVVSREWNEDAFNVMEAIYPGFGTPVILVPSPFSQLSDYLLATINDRAFCVTSSFASSFRFPHSPTEMKIVYAVSMAKENQQLTEFIEELHNIIIKEIKTLFSQEQHNMPLLSFKTNNPNLQVIADNWTSEIQSIIRYQSEDGDVFMEGSEEITDGGMRIQTLVVYPTQYMGNLNMRQLLNYERLYNENRHRYGN